jgi:hypothetical protein
MRRHLLAARTRTEPNDPSLRESQDGSQVGKRLIGGLFQVKLAPRRAALMKRHASGLLDASPHGFTRAIIPPQVESRL